MAKKSKVQARKRVATKDLAPKDAKNVKGGKVSVTPFSIKKLSDSSTSSLMR